jgi:hypothetical protein
MHKYALPSCVWTMHAIPTPLSCNGHCTHRCGLCSTSLTTFPAAVATMGRLTLQKHEIAAASPYEVSKYAVCNIHHTLLLPGWHDVLLTQGRACLNTPTSRLL